MSTLCAVMRAAASFWRISEWVVGKQVSKCNISLGNSCEDGERGKAVAGGEVVL